MAEPPQKRPDPLDEPIDILSPTSAPDEPWDDDEPPASALDDMPQATTLPPEEPAGDEPDASDLPPLDLTAGSDWPDDADSAEPELAASDLSWADAPEKPPPEAQGWHEEGDRPELLGSGEESEEPWVADAALAGDDFWAGLEDERLWTMGATEQASLPMLGIDAVLARPSTLSAHTVLHTPDSALVAMGEIDTPVRIGPVAVAIRLRVVSAESAELIVGQDVLAGHFVVDVRQDNVLRGRAPESG